MMSQWWCPAFLQPFNSITAMLVVASVAMVALVLHRTVRYVSGIWRLRTLPRLVRQAKNWLEVKQLPTELPLMGPLCEMGLERFNTEWLLPQHGLDRRVERGLKIVIQIGPILGMAGTIWGIMLAFEAVAQQGNVPTLRELAPAVGVALKTTLLGLLCAGPCLLVRYAFPIVELHQLEWTAIQAAWKQLNLLMEVAQQPVPVRPVPLSPSMSPLTQKAKRQYDHETLSAATPGPG
jgi:biopolymer transport protein ExbB/TolQ